VQLRDINDRFDRAIELLCAIAQAINSAIDWAINLGTSGNSLLFCE
jgi:hypothetical protein